MHTRRSARSLVLKRHSTQNSANAQSQGGTSIAKSTAQIGKAGVEPVPKYAVEDEEDDDMASFLQFCATCETQLISPGVSDLYCSQICREKDGLQPTSLQILHSPLTTPPLLAYFDDILPQRSPTMVRPLSFSDLSVSDTDFPSEASAAHDGRRGSEAAQYLTQSGSGAWSGQSTPARQPRALLVEHGVLPSLVNSVSSSLGTAASTASSRPLPPRHDKSFSAFGSKNLSLLLPCTSDSSSGEDEASMNSSESTLTTV